MTEPTTSGISRRTLAKGAAWSVPAAAVVAAAPAYAASPKPCVGAVCVTLTGDACKHPGNPKWYHFGVTIKNDSLTDTFTVNFVSMNVNGELKTPTSSPGGLIPAGTTIAPNTTTSLVVDAGLYSNSANGVATLTFSVNGVAGSATTNVNDLPPCGTGSGSPWSQAQPKDDPPHGSTTTTTTAGTSTTTTTTVPATTTTTSTSTTTTTSTSTTTTTTPAP